MMFLMHVAYLLGFLTLVAGVSLYIWSIRNEGAGTGLAKFFGVLIIIFSILDIICIGFYGIKYWNQGYFESPTAMMQNKPMMGGSMMNDGNMQNMMNKQ